MNDLPTDTIAAVATPRGTGGIAIIKISGPDALPILRRIFRKVAGPPAGCLDLAHQQMHYGHIVHPREGVVDEVLVSVMRGPHSYTTQDVVEINCHGGDVVTRFVMALVLAEGARPAAPGEFTRRAFLGGRINLIQAEAVIDLINAKTRKAARAGLQQLSHGVDKKVTQMHRVLLDGLAEIEAYIDFDDDLEETIPLAPLGKRFNEQILPPLEGLIESYNEGRILKEGVRIVIAGRPNVGKSSLVNLLLNQDRVIVTAVPGTTRDIVEETIAIDGTPVVITDTAGIHASVDPIESLGIEKSEEAVAAADLVLFMVDGSMPVQSADHLVYHSIKERKHLIIQNKIDLCPQGPGPIDFGGARSDDLVTLSALTGEGLAELKARILARIGVNSTPEDGALFVNLRQKRLLDEARGHIEGAARFLIRGQDAELAAIEIKDALDNLQEVLGQGLEPDVLDHVFERFCIGK